MTEHVRQVIGPSEANGRRAVGARRAPGSWGRNPARRCVIQRAADRTWASPPRRARRPPTALMVARAGGGPTRPSSPNDSARPRVRRTRSLPVSGFSSTDMSHALAGRRRRRRLDRPDGRRRLPGRERSATGTRPAIPRHVLREILEHREAVDQLPGLHPPSRWPGSGSGESVTDPSGTTRADQRDQRRGSAGRAKNKASAHQEDASGPPSQNPATSLPKFSSRRTPR